MTVLREYVERFKRKITAKQARLKMAVRMKKTLRMMRDCEYSPQFQVW
jgi:hypothetical protein